MQNTHVLTCRLRTVVNEFNSWLPDCTSLGPVVHEYGECRHASYSVLCVYRPFLTNLVLTFADSVNGGRLKPPMGFCTSKNLTTGRPLRWPEKLAR